MKKVLKLTFKNSEGSTNVMTIANPQQDLSAETVKAAMQKIVDSKAFVEDGVELYGYYTDDGYQLSLIDTEYVAQSGDSWYSISRRHGIPINDLLVLNRAMHTDRIYAGQVVRIA